MPGVSGNELDTEQPHSGTSVLDMPHLMRLTALALAILTAVRIYAVFATPLELYPDEAQYWVWSRHLAFGYFSKPPMIAWLIRATTAVGGQSEPWVRLAAPVLHGTTAMVLALAGRRLYSPPVGAAAAAIYALAPGVDLSSSVIATDAPLMLWLSLSLWAYAIWWPAGGESPARRWGAIGFGLALGAAFLAKYAALYFVGGVLLHAALSRTARSRWRREDALLATLSFVIIASPNLVWNVAHHFQTVAHTAADANLGEDARPPWYDPRGGLGYIAGQFGVFGPIPFAVFIIGAVVLWRRKAFTPEDAMLLAFAFPPLMIVLIEAIASRANANWAGAAYGPAAIFVGAVLTRWRAVRTFGATVLSQLAIAAIFLTFFIAPNLADHTAAIANTLKRARGWAASTVLIGNAAANAGRPLSAIAVDDRFLFNALSYYGRDTHNRPAGRLPAPLKMWVREARAHNQAETTAPLDAASGSRVLIANANVAYRPEIMADFTKVEPGMDTTSVPLDPKHVRDLTLFTADGFHRRPRDPITGHPTKP